MSLESKLAELATRRERFKQFRDEVDEDLARQRAERLAAETAAIQQLILEAAAEGGTLGQIKRAYGTKDHRTIADVVKAHKPEIVAIQKDIVQKQQGRPEWLKDLTHDSFLVQVGQDEVLYTWTTLDDGLLMFTTTSPLWDPTFTIRNEAVELLDGKTENESDAARLAAEFIRRQA